ncbi:hypothetical protein [Nocardia sp. NPDC051463]|uniref:hypothetical protein n=1 Tax=Nocardia sp. NPDC051463 TaxID=3154845 RepID=UPI0034505901
MTARIEDAGTGGDDVATAAPTAGQATTSTTAQASDAKPARPATVSIQISTVIRGAVIAALVVAVCMLSGLLWSTRHDITQRDDRAANDRKAEQVATEYSVGAATVNYQDINAWVVKLKANTAPQLANKFEATGPELEQILVPLKWTSSATPITAKVMSERDGIFKVNVFVT